MTMRTCTRQIAAGDFKARCLGLLDDVARTGAELIVTKRGKAVAKVVPVQPRGKRRPPSDLKGSVIFRGDVVSPIDEAWDAGT